MERFFEVFADAHHFADGAHLRSELVLDAAEFFERPTRELDDDVIAVRLVIFERSAAPVRHFVQRHPRRQLRRNERDRETGRLRGQRRRAAGARVDFDNNDAVGRRVVRELDVRAADDADFFDDFMRVIFEPLLQLLANRQHRRGAERVAGVDAHRVDVFDKADGNQFIVRVADDFDFQLFPTGDRLFDQDFRNHRRGQPASDDGAEFLRVVRDPAAGSAHRVRRTHDAGVAEFFDDRFRFFHRVRDFAASGFDAEFRHRVFELEAVFAAFDGVELNADDANAVFFEDARFFEFHRQVQRRLTAEVRKERVRTFLLDNSFDRRHRQRLDIRRVGHHGVGHNRRRVGVDQHDLITEFPQGLARLRSGVVELARLTDDDGAGTDNEDFLYVVATGHLSVSLGTKFRVFFKARFRLPTSLGETRRVGRPRKRSSNSSYYKSVKIPVKETRAPRRPISADFLPFSREIGAVVIVVIILTSRAAYTTVHSSRRNAPSNVFRAHYNIILYFTPRHNLILYSLQPL